MTFDRPWALALLVVPVLLLWLRLRAQRPREAEASSLLIWRKVSPADSAPSKPRPPLAAWLEAGGVLLLVLGLADPGRVAASPGTVTVLLDTSPSMNARRPDGTTRLEHARSLLGGNPVQESGDVAGDLPALRASERPVVVVTDHRLPSFPDAPPAVRAIGVGTRALNAGITLASCDPPSEGGRKLFLSLVVHGAPGPVTGVLHIADARETVTVAPGIPLALIRSPPDRHFVVRFEVDGDSLGADDRIEGSGPVGVAVTCPDEGDLVPLLRALEAAGAHPGARLQEPRTVRLDPVVESDSVVAVYAGPSLRFPPGSDGVPIRADQVAASAHPLAAGLALDPSVTLGIRSGVVTGGEVVLADAMGPLLTVVPEPTGLDVGEQAHLMVPSLHFAFVPGSTWVERDPSFVVFARNLVEFAAKSLGPERIGGVLDPKETREAAEGETFGDLAKALEEARQPDPAARTPLAAAFLFAGAAALAGAWWVQR